MPYIAIPGLPFLRDITELDTIVHHPLQTIHKFLHKYGSHDPVLNTTSSSGIRNNNGSVGEAPSSGSQAMLTMGDDPSCRNLPGVHPPGTPLHSLAMGIARDKAMSTL